MAVMSLTLTPRDPLSTVISAGAGTKAVTGLSECEQPEVTSHAAVHADNMVMYGFMSWSNPDHLS